jgi:hypothetical protein
MKIITNKSLFAIIFAISIFILFLLFAVFLLDDPTGPQRLIFFRGCEDLFADFFNVVKVISNGKISSLYFALSYLILYPFSKLDNFYAMTLPQMWMSRIGIMAAFLFTLFSVSLFFLSLSQLMKKYKVPLYILTGLCLSYIFLYSIERGNLIIMSAAFLILFICYYDSDNINERIWAMIFLAMTVTLKNYPVLMGFLYLKKKQYKEIVYGVIITLLFILLPFLFFEGGLSNIQNTITVYRNIIEGSSSFFKSNYSPNIVLAYGTDMYPRFYLQHIVYFVLSEINKSFKNFISYKTMIDLTFNSKYVLYLLSTISIFLSIKAASKWVSVALLTMVLLFLAATSYLYCGLFIFPMIILYFATLNERSIIFNIYTLISFIVILNPLQIPVQYEDTFININYILANIFLLLLWIVLLTSSIRKFVLNIAGKDKKIK